MMLRPQTPSSTSLKRGASKTARPKNKCSGLQGQPWDLTRQLSSLTNTGEDLRKSNSSHGRHQASTGQAGLRPALRDLASLEVRTLPLSAEAQAGHVSGRGNGGKDCRAWAREKSTLCELTPVNHSAWIGHLSSSFAPTFHFTVIGLRLNPCH